MQQKVQQTRKVKRGKFNFPWEKCVPFAIILTSLAFRSSTQVTLLRGLFFTAAAVCLGACLVTLLRARNSDDSTRVSVYIPPQAQSFSDIVRPPTTGGRTEVMTTTEYDTQEARGLLLRGLAQFGITTMLHFYAGYMPPLFAAALMQCYSVFRHQAVRIHLYGEAPHGDLARPWRDTTRPVYEPSSDQIAAVNSMASPEERVRRRQAEKAALLASRRGRRGVGAASSE